MPDELPNPAAELEGLRLDGRWLVGARRVPTAGASGGNFSQSYTVTCDDGRSGWLKALDIQEAMTKPDWPREVQRLLSDFNFERDLLDLARRMDRVVTAVAHGSVAVGVTSVYYIIFELAQGGDVRGRLGVIRPSDAWLLRTLHQIATGVSQLHSAGIAHQDIKPSNVFLMDARAAVADAKIGDLGRASLAGTEASYDAYPFPGDLRYGPPELLYGDISNDWATRRRAADLYMLGSMIAFLFANVTITGAVVAGLDHELRPALIGGGWRGDYKSALPHVRQAADDAFEMIAQSFPDANRDELSTMMRQLCEPNAELRGHPAERPGYSDRFSLRRYVSRLDHMARQAAIARA